MFSVPTTPRELWEEFRTRPAMYLAEVTMENLRHFLGGYSIAAYIHQISGTDDPFLIPNRFNCWVACRLHTERSASGWNHLISEYAVNEHEAFETFLRLHDEYHSRQPHVVAKVHNFQKACGDYSESSVIADRAWLESSPRPPKTLNFITYTSDPGFFVEAEDDPDFLDIKFFSSFEKFEHKIGVTREQLVILDPDWNPPWRASGE